MSSEEKIVIPDITNSVLVLSDHIGFQESQQPFREVREQLVHVNQDTLLNYGVLDLGTAAKQAILCIQNHVEKAFTQFLWNEKFTQIHTPKLIARSSEGGASCLAQSRQLYKLL